MYGIVMRYIRRKGMYVVGEDGIKGVNVYVELRWGYIYIGLGLWFLYLNRDRKSVV